MSSVLTLNGLVTALEEIYAGVGGLVYPQRLMADWAHHKPIFVRLPGKAMDAWLSRCLIEARAGHQLLVCVPAHTETERVQKALAASTSVLFLNKRLNVDKWSEGAILVGLNIEIDAKLGRYGIIMEKRK